MGEERLHDMVIQAPAKINLWLEVIRKRSDGYHDLSSLMLPIDLCDELEVELLADEGIRFSCDAPEIPADHGNLAWRAADLYMKAAEARGGVRIDLRKRIPVEAGLGGGSSDAASVLIALNRLHRGRLSRDRLHSLAASLGADVPFFLYGRPALATGIGDVLEEVEGVPSYPLVLVNPPLRVSTARVYQSLQLTRGTSHIKLHSFLDRPWGLCDVMQNDLEAVTLSEYPLLGDIKEWLMGHGASGALMSGSGPTLFGIFREEALAAEMAGLARTEWEGCRVAAARVSGGPVSDGNIHFPFYEVT